MKMSIITIIMMRASSDEHNDDEHVTEMTITVTMRMIIKVMTMLLTSILMDDADSDKSPLPVLPQQVLLLHKMPKMSRNGLRFELGTAL